MTSQNSPSIVLIEDNKALGEMYCDALIRHGYSCIHFLRAADGVEYLFDESHRPSLLLLDLKLPDMDGLAVMEKLAENGIHIPVVIITGHGSVTMAVKAIKKGACDFLVKPFAPERLLSVIEAALAGASPSAKNTGSPKLQKVIDDTSSKSFAPDRDFGGFIGASPAMTEIYARIKSAAKSDAIVFITGESGTGKEVCAEAIHLHSRRKDAPFIPLNCAAIPRDLMESELFGHVKGAFTGAVNDREGAVSLAEGGTLFLDEIGEMTMAMQTKLLRFLQDLKYQKVGDGRTLQSNIRIICATNRDPIEEIRRGNFREDLYYRLHVLPIAMPPLRARGNDILDIARVFLKHFAREEGRSLNGFSDEACAFLMQYKWPGNVRQLQNVIRHIAVMNNGDLVTSKMLPHGLLHAPERHLDKDASDGSAVQEAARRSSFVFENIADLRPMDVIERELIESAIKLCGGNIPKAASALGLSPSTIYRKKTSWDEADKAAQVSLQADA